MNTNTVNERTTISLNRETYIKLSHLGFAGQSFDQVIDTLIDQAIEAMEEKFPNIFGRHPDKVNETLEAWNALNASEPDFTNRKDCPAIEHIHAGKCIHNADNKEHGSTFNKSRSSTLDCASNEFMCKSEGLE
jgi:hypothetical protein